MLSNYLRLFFIFAAVCIAYNEVAAQAYGVKGGIKGSYRGGVKGGVRGDRAQFDSQIFMENYFRTICQANEEFTYCQIMEGGTCWERDGADSSYPCREGCDCVTGYLRNSSGLCVLEENCDTTTKPLYYVEPLREFMTEYRHHRKVPDGIRP